MHLNSHGLYRHGPTPLATNERILNIQLQRTRWANECIGQAYSGQENESGFTHHRVDPRDVGIGPTDRMPVCITTVDRKTTHQDPIILPDRLHEAGAEAPSAAALRGEVI